MSRQVAATLVATGPAMIVMDGDPTTTRVPAQPTGFTAATVPARVQVQVRRSGLAPIILGLL